MAQILNIGYQLNDANMDHEDDPEDEEVVQLDVNNELRSGAAASSTDPVAPAEPVRMTVKASNEELKRVRASYRNGVEFSAWLFCDVHRFRRIDTTTLLEDPIVQLFQLGLTKHKTIQGHKDFLISMSNGELSKAVGKVWEIFQSTAFSEELELLPVINASEKQRKQDLEIVSLAWSTALSITSQFGLWELEWTFGLPHFFNRLLDSSVEVRKEAGFLFTKLHHGTHILSIKSIYCVSNLSNVEVTHL